MSSNLVCRTCLQVNTSETCRSIEEVENCSDILEMLSYSIPEMNMYLVIDPVICDICVNMLRTVYKFKVQCLKIEENLLRYAQTVSQSKVNLTEYCKRKITCIQPSGNKCKGSESEKVRKKNSHKKIKSNNNSEECYGCKINSKDPSYHQKTNYSPFICYYCEKQLDRIIDLRRHILGHVKQRQCKICGKCFRDLTVLRRHLWTHTGEKAFACTLCPKKFQQKHCLNQHMFKHQGKDTIKCSYCKKLFSTKYNAKIHMKTMHKKIEICDLCGDKFMSKPELVKHLETNSSSCGRNLKNSEIDVEEKIFETEHIKVEPLYTAAEDSGNKSDEFNENTGCKTKKETFFNDPDFQHFPFKTEVLEDVNPALPKQE